MSLLYCELDGFCSIFLKMVASQALKEEIFYRRVTHLPSKQE